LPLAAPLTNRDKEFNDKGIDGKFKPLITFELWSADNEAPFFADHRVGLHNYWIKQCVQS